MPQIDEGIHNLITDYQAQGETPALLLHRVAAAIGDAALSAAEDQIADDTAVRIFQKNHEHIYWDDGYGLGSNPTVTLVREALRRKTKRNAEQGASDAIELQHHIARRSIENNTAIYQAGLLPNLIQRSGGLAMYRARLHDYQEGFLMKELRECEDVEPVSGNNVEHVIEGRIRLRPEYFKVVGHDALHRMTVDRSTLPKLAEPPTVTVGCPLFNLKGMAEFWDISANAYIRVMPGLVPSEQSYGIIR